MAIAGSVEEASVALVLSSSVDPSIGVNRQFTNSKNSMLHLSARNGWGDTTHRLVAAGADVAQRNKEGFTPLHLAVIHSKPEAVAALLQAGADPNALAADVFPNVSQWRAQRGLRMAAVLMGGPDLRPSQVLAALMAMEPKSSAIDTAVMTIQNIKVVEALVASGAQPSEEALKVGATCTPILKDVVKRTAWSPELHRRLPPRFKVAARELMRCMGRRAVDAAGAPLLMPPNVIVEILTHAAYPLSAWADEEWLAAQQVRQPKEEDRHPAAGAGAGAPAVGVPAGLQGMLPGMLGGADGGGELGPLHAAAMPELMDNLVQHLMQEVAQELGHGNNNDEPNNNNNDQGQLNGGVNQGGAPAVGGDNNGPPGNGGGGGGGPLVLPLPMPPGMGGAGMGLVIVPHVPANLPFDPQAMADMLMGGPPLDFAHGMAQHHHNPQPMPHGAGLAAGEGGGPDEDGVDQEDEEEEEEEVHVVQFQLHFNVNDIFPNGPPPGFPGQGGGAAAPPGAAPAAADPAPQPAPEAVPEVTVQPIVPSPGDGASPSDAGDEAGPSSGTRSRRRTRSAAGGASGADANAGDEGGSGKEAKRARRR